MPKFFVDLFDELSPSTRLDDSPGLSQPPVTPGVKYRKADETASVAEADPFSIDPALVERGNRAHAQTQNRLAVFLTERGFSPKSSAAKDPNFDIAWAAEDAVYVAEIKSLTVQNEEKQLRLGLGQVLRYRQILTTTTGRLVRAVIAVERRPSDDSWLSICEGLDILLVWPETFSRLVGTRS